MSSIQDDPTDKSSIRIRWTSPTEILVIETPAAPQVTPRIQPDADAMYDEVPEYVELPPSAPGAAFAKDTRFYVPSAKASR
jgi:hypothetical protein